MNRISLVVVVTLTLAVAALADEPRYVVRLAATATMGDSETLATRLARTYGASIESVSGAMITLRVSPSRAELLRRDPDVQSVSTSAAVPGKIASHAIDWNTGVSYEYDGGGNVKKIGTDTFSYDVVGRLVEAHTGGVKRQYEYDAFGNRTNCTESNNPCQDAETISALSNRSSVMTYDAAGNVTTHSGHTYAFDEFKMLKSDQYGALTREFIYNANDQRVGVLTSAASGSWWRWTFRDPLSGKVLREFTSEGLDGKSNWRWNKDYIWRHGVLLATVQPNPNGSGTTLYHYHVDHLGSPRRITDHSDLIVGIHDYHAFGPEASGGTDERSLSLVKYTGHERDVVDGHTDVIDYMMARYYSPRFGRFLSPDVVTGSPAKPQSWNRYAYAHNNPTNNLDPDGNVVVGATKWRRDIAHAYANSPTFRSVYDQANHNPDIVARLTLTSKMTNHTRAGTEPIKTRVMKDASGHLMRTAAGDLMVQGTAFKTTMPVMASSNVGPLVGHELTHVNEGAKDGYALTKAMLMPLSATIFQNTTATGAAFESTAAQATEQQISQELKAGGTATLTPAEEQDVFGPSEKFDKWSRKNQERCSADATCFGSNPP